ncbi:MAG TPA: FKBP-type peptidyl-prolyl cis-trans isomerase [Paludibacteraceae bacterium]|nr:FKBP-type peptidyl-prolyl cis-trans isomerase [Paludibacteraceae bacterium]
MKKISILPLAALLLVGCSSVKKVETPVVPVAPVNILTNDVDSMSYALGVNVGEDFAKNIKTIPGGKSNIDLLIKGFASAMKGDSTLLSKDVAQTYFRDYLTKAQNKQNDLVKAEGEKFLADNKLKEGVQVTSSGLQYIILKTAEGAKPQSTDKVKVHYTGTLMDGKVFDSSVERGEPVEFQLNQVIPGWTEGVQLMPVGSKYKFFIPYNLAYGEQGVSQAGIPPFSPLTFEVELLDIIKEQPAPVVEEVKPAAETKTPAKKSTKKK